jgi:predicted glutamine amidotransferase
MCRLLYVRADSAFAVKKHLEIFAEISENSPEYQGHGWGCAWVHDGEWQFHHNIRPVWEDDLGAFGETKLLLAHARSAFRDEGICVENNMPFFDGRHVFIFNGELRGVRIREEGRIGAEKIFNYVKRFDKGDMLEAIDRGVKVMEKRTRYVRAMNFVMASLESGYLATLFNEDPEYFQMHRRHQADMDVLCSVAYPGESGWQAIGNRTVARL